jgi:AcrR family transcriptional regulator
VTPTEGPPHRGSERFELDTLDGLPVELGLARLPPGRHGLARSFVAHNQRLRLAIGMLRTLPRTGYAAATIGEITGEAGVSRSAFYQQFSGKEECFLETHDLATEWFCEHVEAAVDGEQERAGRVRAGVGAALDLLVANPSLAHLLAVEGPQAGPAGRERRRACLDRFAALLLPGRGAPGAASDADAMLLGTLLLLIADGVDAGRAERLPAVTSELVERLLFAGPEAEGRTDAER